MLNKKEQEMLLKIARSTLEKKQLSLKNIPEKLKEKKACFVTLTENNHLRGCIGSIKAIQELYKDVISNTINASQNDYRFTPLNKDEVKDIKIEISVLTEMKETTFDEISPEKDGVLIKVNGRTALFLPQVWEELINKEDFISHLCMKANLPSDYWKNNKIKYYKFQVQKFKE